jgi:hypothetical protein
MVSLLCVLLSLFFTSIASININVLFAFASIFYITTLVSAAFAAILLICCLVEKKIRGKAKCHTLK